MTIPPRSLRALVRGSRIKAIPAGQIVFYQGDEVHEIYVIKSGVVKIHDIDEHGNEKILHLINNKAFLPFAFFSGKKHKTTWFYTTVTDCEFYIVRRAELQNLMDQDPDATQYLMQWFSREVHELLVRLSSFNKTLAEDKIDATLKFLAVLHSTERRGGWCRVNFPVNHQLIADLTGITRESTTLAIKDFSTRGVVRSPKQSILEINFKKLTHSS